MIHRALDLDLDLARKLKKLLKERKTPVSYILGKQKIVKVLCVIKKGALLSFQ
jgi:hypothetical protein